MSRTPADVHDGLMALLPAGWIWPTRDEGSLLAAILMPAATLISEIEAAAEAAMDEIDPRSATHCLPDFERVLGPSCGGEPSALPLADRRRLAHQRWTARGGQSIAYYTSVASKLGVKINIREFWPTRANVAHAGHRLRPEGVQFVWQVMVPAGTPAAMALTLDCELRRIAPAHTTIVITFEGAG